MSILLSVILAAAAPAAAAEKIEEPNPSKMKRAEIRAFNDKVGPDHPYYIRCRAIPQIGSLVAKKTLCRTTQDWARVDSEGNRVARDTVRGLNETAGQMGN